jgi:hypothetical protein
VQFDWLLTRQDFPVLPELPVGNTQFLLPCDESRVSNGKKWWLARSLVLLNSGEQDKRKILTHFIG